MIRTVVCFYICFFLLSNSLVSAQQSSAGQKLINSAHAVTSNGQFVNIPYFKQSDGIQSILTLNSNMPGEIEVEVMIFNAEGEALPVRKVNLRPESITELRLEDLIKDAPGDFESGNIQLHYQGQSMGVTCQISVASVEQRIAFESTESSAMEFMSAKLNGIAVMPDEQTEVSLALTNTSADQLKIQAAVGDNNIDLELGSRQTRVLRLSQYLRQHHVALVRLQHNGLPGDLIATGFALNPDTGYSSNFFLVDPAMGRSNQLAGAHFWFGSPIPLKDSLREHSFDPRLHWPMWVHRQLPRVSLWITRSNLRPAIIKSLK